MVDNELFMTQPVYMDTMFFPNEKNVDKLCSYISKARKTLKICVFTITNNEICKAILDAKYQNGAEVFIITDDECAKARGSDVEYLSRKGCKVRTDSEERFHMHNKFMLIDRKMLITGSFNWTVQAGKSNQENLLVVDHPYYLKSYEDEFDRLWSEFKDNVV